MLDGVTLFLSVINVTNPCKRLCYSQTFGGKLEESEGYNCVFSVSCVRIEIDNKALVREMLSNYSKCPEGHKYPRPVPFHNV